MGYPWASEEQAERIISRLDKMIVLLKKLVADKEAKP
jgi:hypothetical protein